MGLTENKKGQPILISHPSISIAASYRIDANTTALLIRAALGDFLPKSPLFKPNT